MSDRDAAPAPRLSAGTPASGHDATTTPHPQPAPEAIAASGRLDPGGPLDPFDAGLVIGLLVGQGSFGGDGKQPQISLRMHVRHEALMLRLGELFPRTRLYGPYHHGDRSYYQWMARGTALVGDVLPLLEAYIDPRLDGHAAERLTSMTSRYAAYIARERARLAIRPSADPIQRSGDGETQP